MNDKKEYGDYQTPLDFAVKVCVFLKEHKRLNSSTILEPTCGIGNFLRAAKIFDAEKYFGVEINPVYCKICAESFSDERFTILNENFFNCNSETLPKGGNLLIIGNPPWATNSNLSKNLPQKNNFKNLRGIEALTGASNFDICEYIIGHLIEKYRDTDTAVAMLCKTSVARNIFKDMLARNISFSACEIFEFDARKVFGIGASACLLFVQLTEGNFSSSVCNIYNLDEPQILKKTFGYRNGNFYGDLSTQDCDFDGKCYFEWRQGIKHDCSKVMELTLEGDFFKNGNNEPVDVEADFIFPLLKGSAIKNPVINRFSKYVIVTQKFLGEDTSHLEFDAPKVWRYLQENAIAFAKRKSKIYDNATAFAMFGVGNYSYLPYKVCIGGFSKKPFFALVFSDDEKPVMLDDTAYFLSFKDYNSAYMTMLYLNSAKVGDFLRSISFADNKRPFTKKILSRVDFSKVCRAISFDELKLTEMQLGLKNRLTESLLNDFWDLITPIEQKLF